VAEILSFNRVACPGLHRSRWEGISLAIGKGELAVVHVDHTTEDIPFLELALGLLEPLSGSVCWKGRDWHRIPYGAQLRARSRIGSLAKEQVWLSNQTVLRNVMLRQRHHTAQPDKDLEKEADRLAGQVGLDGIPEGRPDAVPTRRLRMAGWVRAFTGKPELLLLMFPEHEALLHWDRWLDALLQDALARGAAALVVSDQPVLWQLPVMQNGPHYGFAGGGWQQHN
jgi:ABC-type transporter Mla maintaining outer membrane lipid asymmetry ATPase subunit MlaF